MPTFATFFTHLCLFIMVDLYYYGTGETGVAKDFSPLFEYNKENKTKFGLDKVKKKSLLRAIEEADARG